MDQLVRTLSNVEPAERTPPPSPGSANWKLEDAKARFSEVVRRAHAEGPQAVTVRDRRSVVILDAEGYDRLTAPTPDLPLVTFLERLDMEGLDLTRDDDDGRDVQL